MDGGILKYLEVMGHETNLWEGDCFIFDKRVSLNKNLGEGEYYIDPSDRIPQKKDPQK